MIIPRREFEEFSRWRAQKKKIKTFSLTSAQQKDLEVSRKEYKKGIYMTIHELEQKLGNQDSSKSFQDSGKIPSTG